MVQTVEYILSAVDRVSAPLLRMADSASRTFATFERLTVGSRSMAGAADGLDNSLAGLRQRLNTLQAERDLVDVDDIDRLRRYNAEIDGLTQQINRLNKAGQGDGLRQFTESLTGGSFSAPQLAAEAVRTGIGGALSLEEGMTQVRIMARLDEQSLDEATQRVQEITARNRADITAAPAILQQVLPQTGSLEQAMAILDAAQQGERAQFAPADVIAQALARMPQEAGTPAHMLDLLATTSRMSGIGFAATAEHLPALLASDAGSADPVRTAGLFATLTSSGTPAEEAVARIGSAGEPSLSAEETLRLADAMRQLAEAGGATERALAAADSVAQQGREAWNALTGQLTQLGTAVLPLLQTGVGAANVLLDGTGVVVGALADLTGGWLDALNEGNPLISALTGALVGLSGVLAAHKLQVLAVSAVHKIVAAGSNVLGVAIRALNAAFVSSPIGWIALGVGTLAGVIYALSTKTDAATSSFAAFNAELAKSQATARNDFEAAMQTAAGSNARADAIARLNTQYGEYLPALLDEKASNDDLRQALLLVNQELERKLLIKFREQAMSDAFEKLNEVRTSLFEHLIKQVDDDQKQALSQDFNRIFDRIMHGEDVDQAVRQLEQDYGVNLRQGKLNRGIKRYRETTEQIRLLYAPSGVSPKGSTAPDATTDLTSIPSLNSPGGNTSRSNADRSSANRQNVLQAAATSVLGSSPAETTTPASRSASGDGSRNAAATTTRSQTAEADDGMEDPKFMLESVAVDRKGSSAYNAIVARLRHVRLSGLTAVASLGMTALPAAAQTPAATDDEATVLPAMQTAPAAPFDETDYGRSARCIVTDKFCDQIVIHIADAGNESMDEIRRKVMNVLMEVTDGF